MFARFVWAAAPLLLAAQAIDPDELRVSWAPYVPPVGAAFHAESTTVEVGIVVRDGHGEAVAGLHQKDFEIADAGKAREITSFTVLDARGAVPGAEAAGQRPRYIVLLFDDFIINAPGRDILKDAQEKGLVVLKAAAERFVKEHLQPGDQVSIVTTARGQLLPFTGDSAALVDGIRKLNGNYRDGIYIRSTIFSAIQDVVANVAKLPEPRMILLASSGNNAELDPKERPLVHDRERRVVARALAANVVIDALDGKGLYPDPLPGVMSPSLRPAQRSKLEGLVPQGREALDLSNDPVATLAYETGGTFFHNSNDLLRGFVQLVQPKVRYLTTFSSDAPPDGRYRAIKVRVARAEHYEVEARPGYYARNSKEETPAGALRLIDRAIRASDAPAGLPVTFDVTTAEGHAVVAGIHVDVRQLPFEQRDGRRVQKLTFAAVLLDAAGEVVTGKVGTLEFALKESSYQSLSKAGVNGTLVLSAPVGSYRLRSVVHDQSGSRVSAALTGVVVPRRQFAPARSMRSPTMR